jgi:hypothetical protein
MLASFAEFERETIAERVREGVRRSLKHGKRFGMIPYGYDITETGEFVVVEEEAARVRELFTNIADGGTLYSEAARLNAEGVPAPGRKYRGKPRQHGDTWGHASIRNFIHQSAYTGLHVVRTKRGELNREVPAIVPEEVARAARARLAENRIANLKLLMEAVEADIAHRQQDYIAAQGAALWLASLRDGLKAPKEDTEEAFFQRREVVRLLVERITISAGENGQVKIDIMYKFCPPEPEEETELCAVGNTLRSSGQDVKPYNVHQRRGGVAAWRDSHRTPRPT